jgi:uncharacterized protein YbjT (DUF2867 family)
VILVTGATGNVGSELVRALVARHEPVRALARKPNGAAYPGAVDVVSGDLEALDTVAPALVGIRKVFLLGGFATTDLVRRIRDSGVEHVVLLTSRCVIAATPGNAITRMWLDAEAAVRDSGVPWTILRPSGFHPTRCAGSPSSTRATSCGRRGPTWPSHRSTPPTSPPWLRRFSPSPATRTPHRH